MVTRRQHTVWRHYLRAWAPDEQIWCAMKGKVFPSNLMGVGQERDFYRTQYVTADDLKLLQRMLIDPIKNPVVRELTGMWLEPLTRLQRMHAHLEAQGVQDLDERLEPLYIEQEELLQGAIESNAIPLLAQLLASDRFCLESDEDYHHFMHYMMVQYFRTSRIKQNLIRSLDASAPGYVERTIGLLRHTMATVTAWNLIDRRATMRPYLLSNTSDVPLITGDQPVINTYAVYLPADEMPEKSEFYYPLSPTKALIVTEISSYTSGTLTAASVAAFNKMMAHSAERQIFASEQSVLRPFLEVVGSHVG